MHRASAVCALLLGAVCALAALSSVAASCDYRQEVEVGKSKYIFNPNYPDKYNGATQCRWSATTAPGSRLQLSCGLFDIPASQDCQEERVLISTSGDDSLKDARIYCGRGTLSLVSDENKLTMGLLSSDSTAGGRFLCNITANNPSCMCGIKKETRIVGGEYTGVNEYPFMAGLVDFNEGKIFCGASILSAHYALTAAHCFNRRDVSHVGLLVGDHNISTGVDTNATKLFMLQAINVHPRYKKDRSVTNSNDIALVRVAETIPMSREVMPVCLPFRFTGENFTNETVAVLGWGNTEFNGAQPDTLKKVDLRVWSAAKCAAIFPSTNKDQQICTHNEGKDACQRDSGGPLYWQEESSRREFIVGVVSYGSGCATEEPGVNTRVTTYLDWITSIISSDQYCVI